MLDEVSVREDLQIIQVDSWGAVTEGEMRRSLETVIHLEQHTGLDRIFVDASRVTSLPSKVSLYGFGTEMAVAIGTMKAAILASKEARGALEYLEGVAASRGARVGVFESEHDALSWLLAEPRRSVGNRPR